MKVSFFGHADLDYSDKIHELLYTKTEDLIKEGADIFLLGGYGRFDIMAANIVNKLKLKYTFIKSILVIPYLNRKYDTDLYDETLYPPLEKVPKRAAIIQRNYYMVDISDIIVFYVTHSWGGASKVFEYAIHKKKKIFNLYVAFLSQI